MALDRLKALEVFVHVAELGSFTHAADALGMPKPTVSTLVQQLEQHLGVQLLHRTTRRLTLTADGLACKERAQALLRETAELESDLRGASRAPRGRLRADVPAAWGRHIIMPALPQFCAAYPELVLEIGSSDRPVDLVREGVDCVLRGGNIFDESLVARPLGAFEVVTCAAPAYLAAHGTPQALDELERHQFVNYFSNRTGLIFPFEFIVDGQLVEISGRHRIAVNDADSYTAAGLAGMGLMQAPRTAQLRRLLEAGALVQVLPQWSAGRLPMTVLYPRSRHLSARVRVFADWIAALFAAQFEENGEERPQAASGAGATHTLT